MVILTMKAYFLFILVCLELGYVEDEIFKKRQQNEVSSPFRRNLCHCTCMFSLKINNENVQ